MNAPSNVQVLREREPAWPTRPVIGQAGTVRVCVLGDCLTYLAWRGDCGAGGAGESRRREVVGTEPTDGHVSA